MNDYTKLARNAIKTYLKTGEIMSAPKGLPQEFYKNKAGIFVTIYNKTADNKKELRGCIGTYMPARKNIAEEIIHNAIAASTEDYRFSSLSENEIDNVLIEVSVLSKPERVFDLKTLDEKKYGVIVSTGAGCRGLLLPGIDTVTNPEEQIAIACQKGGINPSCEKIILHRFTVEKYGENL